jgi:hypothetical protein
MRTVLVALLALGACAGRQGCTAVLLNAGSQPVEQLYLTPDSGGPTGPDLLADAPLPPGARLALRFPGRGRYGLRAVLVNGRAVELAGLQACKAQQVTIGDAALRVE